VKLREYLAVGRPVVTTPFPELRRYAGLVREAPTAEAFAVAIRDALTQPGHPDVLRAAVRAETWDARAATVLGELARRGIRPATRAD
jgi:hypothetical protein